MTFQNDRGPSWSQNHGRRFAALTLLVLVSSLACRPRKVLILPETLTVAPAGQADFTSEITGLDPQGWSWSVQETGGGAVDGCGHFQAATQEGTFHITLSNPRYPDRQAFAAITVKELGEVVPSKAELNKDTPEHRATLLPDGKVLVTSSALCGLYDPARDEFAVLPRLPIIQGLEGHTATALPDGQVLLQCNSEAILFDPVKKAFHVTGRPLVPRRWHTATLLKDGRVLVAGGESSQSRGFMANDSLEIFDPAAGVFRLAGQMTHARALHTATLLPDGQVLLAGGYGGANHGYGMADAETYDPVFGNCTPTQGSMSQARQGHLAIPLTDGNVLMLGDRSLSLAKAVAEVFNPVTRSFSQVGGMAAPRIGFSAVLLPDGKVLVVGGDSDTLERYDPIAHQFSPLQGRLAGSRVNGTAVCLLSGQVWVCGGYVGVNQGNPACERVR